jgi:hypothetical protein
MKRENVSKLAKKINAAHTKAWNQTSRHLETSFENVWTYNLPNGTNA